MFPSILIAGNQIVNNIASCARKLHGARGIVKRDFLSTIADEGEQSIGVINEEKKAREIEVVVVVVVVVVSGCPRSKRKETERYTCT